MKRRVGIAIILSVMALVLTTHIWLIWKPLNFEMNINSNKHDKPIYISLLLNRKDEPNYTNTYDEFTILELNTNNRCNIVFKHKSSPKRFKLTLGNTIPKSEYILSDISFNSGKKNIEDLSLFSSNDAKLIVKENSLIVIPNESTATIEYNAVLSIRYSIKFDLKIFLIIGILSYLLFYKLSSYFADLKINQNVSRLDIIFLTICTILLFIPVFNINQSDISKKENRVLTKYKPLFDKNNNLNFNYGKDFEAWFNDRFGCRYFLVDLFKSFQFYSVRRYYKTKKAYLDKQTHWEFNYSGDGNSLEEKPIDEIQQQKINKELNKFNNFCKENNIKLYLLIIPSKNNIYSQNTYLKNIKNNALLSVNSIIDNTDISVIYPYDELKKESLSNYVYFKTDHHWTDTGAFIGYQALMKEVRKDYPKIKIVNKSDFNITQNKLVRSDWDRAFYIGHTSNMLKLKSSIANRILDTNYDYYTHKDSEIITKSIIDIPNLKQKDFYYPKGLDINAIMIGTSMNENLTEILPYTFQHTRYLRLNNIKCVENNEEFKIIKRLKQNILNYRPDIMILCITSWNIPRLENINNEE